MKLNMTENLLSQRDLLQNLASEGLKEAKAQGADACKIVIGTNSTKRLVVESGELSLASTLETRSVGVLVYKDQKKGSASINMVNKDGLRKAVSDALAIAKFSVADPYLVMPSVQEAPPAPSLPFFYQEALAELSIDELQKTMVETLGILAQDPRIAVDRYELSLDVSWNGLANSFGVHQEIKQAMANWMFMGMARDGDQVTGMDYDSYFSYKADGLVASSLREAKLFAQKLLRGLNPIRCPTYKGVVVLSPRAVTEILLDFIHYHSGGRQVMDGKSRWAKAVGTEVLSPLVSLYDDPHNPMFSSAANFDGDGLPTKPQKIIENGRLNFILHDCYSAKRCATKSTATSGGPFAARFGGGTTPLSELLKGYEQVLLVDRFSGNTDPVDGNFSGVAKASRLYRNGIDQGAVIETMVTGNFFEIAGQVLALSKETEMVSGSVESPYFFVDGVSVTGS